ncbi:hypothetical protein [Natranaeroarchaeum sulfidigenes]|uniref:Uncharacterized protein n=1 Tax=Natranaeroarchaeum sulfidigenes TaxID=2784880 RepID=A0A897MLU8_9EURY|nr:hypothetical protein [Natranaeroarchaeum sulfidigenes]QSG01587.1 hypothetical protein AArcS_0357 [Natranaeroarchaeum sulfidigenes]
MELDTRAAYDALIDDLVADARARAEPPENEDVWASVSDRVPELTGDVCDRILTLSTTAPDAELVEEVTAARDSTEAERKRAQALTVLVQDVETRLDERTD